MTTKQKPRRPAHGMVEQCPCGEKFVKTADILDDLLAAYRAWYAEHREHRGEK